jgi:hypothetical protein
MNLICQQATILGIFLVTSTAQAATCTDAELAQWTRERQVLANSIATENAALQTFQKGVDDNTRNAILAGSGVVIGAAGLGLVAGSVVALPAASAAGAVGLGAPAGLATDLASGIAVLAKLVEGGTIGTLVGAGSSAIYVGAKGVQTVHTRSGLVLRDGVFDAQSYAVVTSQYADVISQIDKIEESDLKTKVPPNLSKNPSVYRGRAHTLFTDDIRYNKIRLAAAQARRSIYRRQFSEVSSRIHDAYSRCGFEDERFDTSGQKLKHDVN